MTTKQQIMSNFNEFTQGYVTCLFECIGYYPRGHASLIDLDYTDDDLTLEAVRKIDEDCSGFQKANLTDLSHAWAEGEGIEDAQLGADFYLSRNRVSGSGFKEEGLGKVGTRLEKSARAYGLCKPVICGGRVHLVG